MDSETTKIFLQISTQLGSLDGHVKGVLDLLKNHESRIQSLESRSSDDAHGGVTPWLIKCLFIALAILGYVTGAAGFIQSIGK